MGEYLVGRMRDLMAYVPGTHEEEGGVLRLNTNESPYPPSPGVTAAVSGEVKKLGFYNDPDCLALRRALADVYGVEERSVICTNGSDELLFLAFMAFADEKHPILLPDVTYGYYAQFAAALGVSLERRALREDFTVDVRDYLGAGRTIVLANPNAPTGYALGLEEVEEILRSSPDNVLILDEAYVDFGAESALPLIERWDNLLIVRTFSKSRSMAGARIGFGLAAPSLIAQVERVRNAVNLYSVSRMAQAAGEAACRENGYYMDNCRRIIAAREWTIDALREMGFEATQSLGNFVFARHPRMKGKEIAAALAARGILVRRWDEARVKEWLRITVGTQEQMERLIRELLDITAGEVLP